MRLSSKTQSNSAEPQLLQDSIRYRYTPSHPLLLYVRNQNKALWAVFKKYSVAHFAAYIGIASFSILWTIILTNRSFTHSWLTFQSAAISSIGVMVLLIKPNLKSPVTFN